MSPHKAVLSSILVKLWTVHGLCCFPLTRWAWGDRTKIPGAGEGSVYVRWKWLVPCVPAASSEQTGRHGRGLGPDEQHPLGLGLSSRGHTAAGEWEKQKWFCLFLGEGFNRGFSRTFRHYLSLSKDIRGILVGLNSVVSFWYLWRIVTFKLKVKCKFWVRPCV